MKLTCFEKECIVTDRLHIEIPHLIFDKMAIDKEMHVFVNVIYQVHVLISNFTCKTAV